jgi:hypothetical protein
MLNVLEASVTPPFHAPHPSSNTIIIIIVVVVVGRSEV